MPNWKLTLSYDGTAFHGWQVQPGLPTIQRALQVAVAQVTGETVLPQGSGRTDAGVHALAQVASFALDVSIPAENLRRALNRALPQSIRVIAAETVSDSFHARHSVARKTYEYRIWERGDGGVERVCPPFVAPYAWDCRWAIEVKPMEEAAAMLLGTHDFTSFGASDPDLSERSSEGGRNPVKTIFASEWVRRDGLLVYRITGNGFLHHMVRNVVGTMVEVGRGALAADGIGRILEARDRSAAGPTAPAQGLYLVEVEYRPEQENGGRA